MKTGKVCKECGSNITFSKLFPDKYLCRDCNEHKTLEQVKDWVHPTYGKKNVKP